MEIIKNTIRVGNSAGVLLPKEWLGSSVRVILEKPDVDKEILEVLMKRKILDEVLGAYIVGSYARNEETINSDIDVLIITESLNKKIKEGKYEIICITRKEIDSQLKNNALPILPMLKEARTIINKELLKEYNSIKININTLNYHLKTTIDSMQEVKKDIEFSKKIKENVSDASAYSLILRLRTLYIIECLRKGKIWSKKEFLELIEKISGSTTAYERYLSSKNYNTKESKLKIEEAEKLREYINKKIGEIKRWLQEKKD
jgi:predicted nucleotidyltransferase